MLGRPWLLSLTGFLMGLRGPTREDYGLPPKDFGGGYNYEIKGIYLDDVRVSGSGGGGGAFSGIVPTGYGQTGPTQIYVVGEAYPEIIHPPKYRCQDHKEIQCFYCSGMYDHMKHRSCPGCGGTLGRK